MRRLRAVNFWGPPALLALALTYYLGYVKDDAYISFRYAAHWAGGQGLVFNPGDHTEGYTNFLWTAAVSLLIRVGVPALIGAKVLGAAAAFAGLYWLRRLAAEIEPAAAPRAAWLWAASPTVGLWAASGLEPTAAAALTALAFLLLARGRALWAGLALGACALLRPEGHLVALAGLALAPRAALPCLALLVPYHLWRWHTFGDLVPNPYSVKAAVPALGPGLRYAGLFLLFYGHGLLFALALLRRGRLARVGAGLAVVFLLYLIYVGGDEMRWFRLFAPALPLLLVLSAPALPRWLVPGFVLFGLVAHATDGWHLRSYLAQDERAYFPLPAAITARARPGDSALFQDCGATPFRALAIPFHDPIGVTDRRIARMYAAARWSPFRGFGPEPLERALREELFARDPRFIALVAYIPRELERDV